MDRSRQQLERDLVRTETSLQFMQKEHQKTLSGLHEEIAQLTKKYSDMQFLMAMQADTSNLAEQQKDIIKRLQSDCDCLQSQLSQSEQRESEMASQLSWERVQHDNLVACLKRQLEEKDILIVKLKKDQETNSDVAKIQAEVKKIYLDKSSHVQNTIQDVSRRARSPVGIRIRRRSRPRTKEGAEASDDSLESYSSLFSSLTEEREGREVVSVPQPALYVSPASWKEKQERRAQVFRHHTKLSDHTPYYSFSAPPLPARSIKRTSTLPIDYKASVATLPYLAREEDLNSPLGESSL